MLLRCGKYSSTHSESGRKSWLGVNEGGSRFGPIGTDGQSDMDLKFHDKLAETHSSRVVPLPCEWMSNYHLSGVLNDDTMKCNYSHLLIHPQSLSATEAMPL